MDEKTRVTLEYIRDLTDRPLINPIETGFRHTQLSVKEQLDRYNECCEEVHRIVLSLLEQNE